MGIVVGGISVSINIMVLLRASIVHPRFRHGRHTPTTRSTMVGWMRKLSIYKGEEIQRAVVDEGDVF